MYVSTILLYYDTTVYVIHYYTTIIMQYSRTLHPRFGQGMVGVLLAYYKTNIISIIVVV